MCCKRIHFKRSSATHTIKMSLEKCKNDSLCEWYSYTEKHNLCILLEDCQLDANNTIFQSGQSECPLPSFTGEHFNF